MNTQETTPNETTTAYAATATAAENPSQQIQRKGAELFPFDVPPVITLKDGTVHHFRLPTRQDEQRREDRMKSVIITSPARINGQNPRQSTTDYSKAEIAYYEDLIEGVQGFPLTEGAEPNQLLQANQVVDTAYDEAKKKDVEVTIGDLVPTKHKRAAASRIFSGKIEVEKPKTENAVEGDAPKPLLVLRAQRKIVVVQQVGVEQNDDGTFSDPTHTIRYVFNEPQAKHLSAWETKCFNGFTVPLGNGGSREERTFNLEAVENLFDSLIDDVQGAALGGQPINVREPAQKARVPLSLKKTTTALMMSEVTGDVGN